MKFFVCIANIFYINFILFIKKKINKKKIIIFYHPNVKLINIHTKFIENLLNHKKYFVIHLHQNHLLNKNKYFFLINYFCKFIINSDYFISNNVCDFFSHRSKRIYIHHDIYDTPLIDKKKEGDLRLRLSKYQYILLASNITKKIFSDLFENYKKKPKIKVIGYFKLDVMLDNRINKKKKVSKKSIIIAPTNYLAFKKFSLYRHLDELIATLLKLNEYNIIFRPHPSNINSFNVTQILNKYSNFNKFYFDKSSDYSKTYLNSLALITDISGTAYTYAFYTKNPVIFFRTYKKFLEKKFHNLKYFQDRKKIGTIFDSLKSFKKINLVIAKKVTFKKNIMKILKNNFSIGKTKNNLFTFLENISE